MAGFDIEFLKRQGRVIEQAPMHRYTTFKTGGDAECLVSPSDFNAAAEIVAYATEKGIPLTVIGAGSNLLISDRGLGGIVMRISSDTMTVAAPILLEDGRIYCEAGFQKEDFITYALENGFGGVEFMAGIPGAMGGGIVMNAGTFMGTFIDILEEIRYIDREGSIRTVKATKEMAHYRGIDLPEAAVICGGIFRLPRVDTAELGARIDAIIEDRHQKHPWTYPSAGSVFKNPEGHFAWKLVNDSGLKGYRVGGAMVSDLHTNFIINAGGASSSDVRSVVRHVQETVQARFGVALHTEIRMLGEF